MARARQRAGFEADAVRPLPSSLFRLGVFAQIVGYVRGRRRKANFLKMQDYSKVMPVSALRANSSVVAEVRPSPNHDERRGKRHRPIRSCCTIPACRTTKARSIIFAIRSAKCRRTMSCCRTATSSKWSRKTARLARRHVRMGGRDRHQLLFDRHRDRQSGHEHGYSEFPGRQIAAVTALCRSIFTRHQDPPQRGSPIRTSPRRASGIRARSFRGRCWPTPDRLVGQACRHHPAEPFFALGETNPPSKNAKATGQVRLQRAGKRISRWHDARAIAAFQRHSRPQRVDGIVDVPPWRR